MACADTLPEENTEEKSNTDITDKETGVISYNLKENKKKQKKK